VTELREYAVQLRNEMLKSGSGEETALLFPDPGILNRKTYSQRKNTDNPKKGL